MKITITVPTVVCVSCKKSGEGTLSHIQQSHNGLRAVYRVPLGWVRLNVDHNTDYENTPVLKERQYFNPFAICPECYVKGEGQMEYLATAELS